MKIIQTNKQEKANQLKKLEDERDMDVKMMDNYIRMLDEADKKRE